ncbi:MAG: hypothetical protein EXR72_21245 [Myxococcales bacterium]|nr:hypothetical protein [Myxococcales bacterium]
MKVSLLLALLPSLAQAKPVIEKLGDLTIDFSAGTIEVRGAGAPDLRAPSAEIARLKAERTAREDAARRLKAGLAAIPTARLGCNDPTGLTITAALKGAETKQIDWGSDGSVTLTLRVPLDSLFEVKQLHLSDLAEVDKAILVAPDHRPTLFGGYLCAETRSGLRLFETVAEARAAMPELKSLRVVRGTERGTFPAAFVRSEK